MRFRVHIQDSTTNMVSSLEASAPSVRSMKRRSRRLLRGRPGWVLDRVEPLPFTPFELRRKRIFMWVAVASAATLILLAILQYSGHHWAGWSIYAIVSLGGLVFAGIYFPPLFRRQNVFTGYLSRILGLIWLLIAYFILAIVGLVPI